ncbi:MAG TPA: hypothetical protein VN324_07220 [Quisquiliibacterium sp.]|nr:hypothetical protein [Quisquiliibacterium sp.]
MTEDDHAGTVEEALPAEHEQRLPVERPQRRGDGGVVREQQRGVLVEQRGGVAQRAAAGADAVGGDRPRLQAVELRLDPREGQPDQRVEEVVPAAGLVEPGRHLAGRPDVDLVGRAPGGTGIDEADRQAVGVAKPARRCQRVQPPDAARPASRQRVVADLVEQGPVRVIPGRAPAGIHGTPASSEQPPGQGLAGGQRHDRIARERE